MARRPPGRLWQTTKGSELLEIHRPAARWARRLLWTSLAVAALALLAFAISLARHAHHPARHIEAVSPPADQTGFR